MNTWKDKALFTPGPLTTSRTVKQSMLCDMGSRDVEFIQMVKEIRKRLVQLGGCSEEKYTSIIMQGSGTFGVESVLSSIIPANGKLLVLVNGAYGERMVQIAQMHHINVVIQQCPENQIPDVLFLKENLDSDPEITHVAVVHCETTTGIINPIKEIGSVVKNHDCIYIVDAMSSFGAYTIPVEAWGIDFLVSSSNKCIEGVPGFSFILARKDVLISSKGSSRSLALDLLAQWEGLEKNGQFRFTPPIQVIRAFHQALVELDEEGGCEARGERYRKNYEMTLREMQKMGFIPYLDPDNRGYIITSFRYPTHSNFSFLTFYQKLSDKGCVIYPGKLSHADCFRIGHIGRLDESDVFMLISAIKETLAEMDIELVHAY
ncbi:2-aminoethylphosphonate--pyruvate transaminase [Leptolinea tardivitalis]|uniref:2-aminoethylphosphonate--pyruvate transaminase n=1 Tax=Leptolinea tardivitalis TaxID=229920 RepID=A0A0P6X6I6_9CHLR|nr:2-aminoethylphosphonate--pyruvate transaminase [Leptolinea tardivitalis]KPL70543.1 2-aminoethylphosphonate--pyruvate aminotransferase [Leptolinea tardivitalis]GAP22147.1 2-aminoethylphosphonate--pyruvate transaminase [Leptolinea tardivitalis]